jgi:hypothetical protein
MIEIPGHEIGAVPLSSICNIRWLGCPICWIDAYTLFNLSGGDLKIGAIKVLNLQLTVGNLVAATDVSTVESVGLSLSDLADAGQSSLPSMAQQVSLAIGARI